MIENIGEYLDRRVRSLQRIGRIMTTDEVCNGINDIRQGLGLPTLDFAKGNLRSVIKCAFRPLSWRGRGGG